MAKGRQGSRAVSGVKVTWAQATRDVLNRSMSTGQLLPICIFILLVIAFCRLPESELASILHDIIDGVKDGSLWGWGFSITVVGAWSYHAKVMRREFSLEADRIGMEKTRLQQEKTQHSLGTSSDS
ncbi:MULTISPECIES: hypothetical protein [unclassified Serratia (in: enterobacteria)]|uniref:hypothetical protein n=1 Tax=unclassified Serratia (in: enterobacteria) TaxID=2647522 RepID=UPI0030767A56